MTGLSQARCSKLVPNGYDGTKSHNVKERKGRRKIGKKNKSLKGTEKDGKEKKKKR